MWGATARVSRSGSGRRESETLPHALPPFAHPPPRPRPPRARRSPGSLRPRPARWRRRRQLLPQREGTSGSAAAAAAAAAHALPRLSAPGLRAARRPRAWSWSCGLRAGQAAASGGVGQEAPAAS